MSTKASSRRAAKRALGGASQTPFWSGTDLPAKAVDDPKTAGLEDALLSQQALDTQAETPRQDLQLLAKVFQEAPVGIVMTSRDGRFIRANPAFCQMLGYSQEELSRMTFLDVTDPEHRGADVENVRQLWQGKIPQYRTEKPYLTKNGETRWGGLSASLVPAPDGKPLYALAVVEDITERRRADQALRHRADELAALQATVLEITSQHDLQTLLQTVVERAARLLGAGSGGMYLCDPDRREARCVVSFNTPHDYVGTVIKYGEGAAGTVAETGEPLIIDNYREWGKRARVFDGQAPFTAVISVPMLMEHQVSGVLHVLDDTTSRRFTKDDVELLSLFANHAAIAVQNARLHEAAAMEISVRQHAEHELSDNSARFHRLVSQLNDVVWSASPDGLQVIDVNGAFAGLYGRTEEEYRANPRIWIEAVHPEDRKIAEDSAEALLKNGQTVAEYRIVRPDGTVRWINDRKSLIYDDQGNVVQIGGVANDITARKQTEEALLQAQAKYRTIFEHATEAITQTSPEGLYITANPAAARMLGYDSPEDLIGGVRDIGREFYVDPDRRREFIARHERSDTIVGFESEVYRKDGSTFWISEDSRVVRDEHGKLLYYEGTAQDITERKRAELALEQRARELQALYETSMEVTARTSLEQLLNSIVKRAASLLGTDSGGLYLTEPDEKTLRLVVGHNRIEPYVGLRVKFGEGLSGRVLETGEPTQVADYRAWPGHVEAYRDAQFRRVLAIPLRAHDKIIGVIHASDSQNVGSFSDDEVRLGLLFAEQASLAIETTRLYEDERGRRRELELLYESALALSSDLSLDAVLRTVVKQVTGAFMTDGCILSALDRSRDALVLLLDDSPTVGATADPAGTTYSLSDYPATRRILESRQPVLQSRDDQEIDPAELAVFDKTGMGTSLLVPLVARGEVSGLMEMFWKDSRRVISSRDMHLAQSLSSQIAVYLESARQFERSEQRLARTLALRNIDQAIAGTRDNDLTFSVVLANALSQLGVDAADILLYNAPANILEFASGAGFRTEALQYTRLPMGQGYAGRAALERRIVTVSNLQTRKTDFLRSPTFSQEGFVSYFAVPLLAKGELQGVLEVFHRTAFVPNTEWLDFLETLAGTTAIAIEGAKLFLDLQNSNMQLTMAYDATIEGWSHAMDLRDRETEGHSRRVTETTLQLARVLGLPEDQMVHIRRGALLHDIGKMGVADRILQKPGPLTPEEWQEMKKHPTMAHEMLSRVRYLERALEIPFCHHEKWNGTGYPRGLKGDEIPLAARVFAVVDVFDALTSDRPYRPAWSALDAREYIRAQAGEHFDPAVAAAFLKMLPLEA